MLRDQNLTDGIGVRTALNILFTSTKDVLVDLDRTSATNVKQKKTKMSAQPKH